MESFGGFATDALHRQALNDAFERLVVCDVKDEPVQWSEKEYAGMQALASGTAQQLREYFGRAGWPLSAGDAAQREALVAGVAQLKDARFREMVEDGDIEARPGVLRILDEAVAAGLKVAVCSRDSRASLEPSLRAVLGEERVEALNATLTGEDVFPAASPDPAIYKQAAQRLGLRPQDCLVFESSPAGLKAAREAGCRCVVTYTDETKQQQFPGAERIISALGFPANVTVQELVANRVVQDDRWEMTLTDSGIYFHQVDESEQDLFMQ